MTGGEPDKVKPDEKPKKSKKAKPDPTKPKRGPARPYRKLAQDILNVRIAKLEKRLDRAKNQAREAEGFLTKYTREQGFRAEDTPKTPE